MMSLININNKNNVSYASFELAEKLIKYGLNSPIFLCIGNSNVVGDLFGPMCGEMLKRKQICNVVGDLSYNVTLSNLSLTYNKLRKENPFNPIIVVDSALSNFNDVGMINFLPYGCLPAHEKNNQIMGDFSILANVNVLGINNFLFLKTVKFNMVKQMAQFVCNVICEALKLKKNYENNSNNFNVNVGY